MTAVDSILSTDPAIRELQEMNGGMVTATRTKSVVGCADCGSRELTWASINLGILLCIECSGVHRSMGSHISKVRSILLDKLDPVSIEVIKAMGNAASNRIWEPALASQEGWAKLVPDAPRALREQFIRAKYQVSRVF